MKKVTFKNKHEIIKIIKKNYKNLISHFLCNEYKHFKFKLILGIGENYKYIFGTFLKFGILWRKSLLFYKTVFNIFYC